MIGGILSCLIATTCWALVQVVWCHTTNRPTTMKHLAIGWLWSVPLLALLIPATRSLIQTRFLATPLWEDTSYALLTHLFALLFAFLYYGSAERSVTVRLLVELLRTHGAGLTLDQLRQQYSTEDMIRRRLSDMNGNGLVSSRDGLWFSTPKGTRLAVLMRISNWIFRSAGQHERI